MPHTDTILGQWDIRCMQYVMVKCGYCDEQYTRM